MPIISEKLSCIIIATLCWVGQRARLLGDDMRCHVLSTRQPCEALWGIEDHCLSTLQIPQCSNNWCLFYDEFGGKTHPEVSPIYRLQLGYLVWIFVYCENIFTNRLNYCLRPLWGCSLVHDILTMVLKSKNFKILNHSGFRDYPHAAGEASLVHSWCCWCNTLSPTGGGCEPQSAHLEEWSSELSSLGPFPHHTPPREREAVWPLGGWGGWLGSGQWYWVVLPTAVPDFRPGPPVF